MATTILTIIAISTIVSTVITNLIAIYYFKKIEEFVNSTADLTKSFADGVIKLIGEYIKKAISQGKH